MKLSLAICCLVSFLSASASGSGLAPGDYVLVYGRLEDCEQRQQLVGWAHVSEQGQVRFASGIEFSGVGLNEEELLAFLVTSIAERTGKKPKSLLVRVVSIVDAQMELELLRMLLRTKASCDSEQPFPPPEKFRRFRKYYKPPPPGEFPPFREGGSTRVSSAIPPNRAFQQTLDPVALFAAAKSAPASRADELGR